MIHTNELTKCYGSLCAVDHLNWDVPLGSICGLLGPNGAGKSTTFKVLLGIAHPTSGDATVGALNVKKESVQVRGITAFLPEDKVWYPGLTCGEFLKVHSSFFRSWSQQIADRLIQTWQIPLKKKQETLPKGMHTKVLLTAVLSSNAPVLLLDEPTEGLDPASTEEILTTLTDIVSDAQRTIVIATHRLDEVQRICDRIAILHQGRLKISGNLDDIKESWKVVEVAHEFPIEELREWKEVFAINKNLTGCSIIVHENPGRVMERLRNYGSPFQSSDMNLREIYLAITGFTGESRHANAQTVV